MTPLDLFYIAAGVWAVAALAGGGWSLVYGNTAVTAPGGPTVVGGPLQLQATSLAGVFAALLGVVAVAIAWFLALSEAGFPLVVAAFVILSSKTGSRRWPASPRTPAPRVAGGEPRRSCWR